MNRSALKPITFWQQVFTLFVLLFVGFGSLAGLVFDAGNAFGHHGEAHPSQYYTETFNRYTYVTAGYVSFIMPCPVCSVDRYYYELYDFFNVHRVTRDYTVYYSGHEEITYESVVFLSQVAFSTGYGYWGTCTICADN